MKYRGIFEYEYPTEHKPPVSIDVHLHGDCVKGKIIEWEYRPLEQEPRKGQYEKHIDHTDCIWYGSDSGCPVTFSQYRDGWNDAMDYIFKNGNGYQPYRHDG